MTMCGRSQIIRLKCGLLDVAPVLAYAYFGDDGDGELGYVFHLVLD